MTTTLSSRERVRLALEHQETDRIPIAMVCAGINPPAWRELETYLQRERGIDVQTYLDGFIDVLQVDPAYTGPPLPANVDIWGVQRRAVSYGSRTATTRSSATRWPMSKLPPTLTRSAGPPPTGSTTTSSRTASPRSRPTANTA